MPHWTDQCMAAVTLVLDNVLLSTVASLGPLHTIPGCFLARVESPWRVIPLAGYPSSQAAPGQPPLPGTPS